MRFWGESVICGAVTLLREEPGLSVTPLTDCVGAEGFSLRVHRLSLVQIGESQWLADVGLGDNGVREPFLLTIRHLQRRGRINSGRQA